MTEVERQLGDGWRYLRLTPAEFFRLTPREFQIMMRMEREHLHDELERAARIALMHEQAARAKRPKLSDLYKRPTKEHNDETLADKAEAAHHAQEWLAQFTFETREKNKERR
ncbi:phage tail assembly chaperone [Salipaludibacillus sp. LMS25]|uniref:phage tail assembly chaperone n=1 Tax=Salipaludibacillus sp. LMS25 TaxID=2924031 RepID=UPI0020D09E7E|nr:phage tail assembly chaperone [Salipaludibacillus sp. LMS25]